MHTDLFLMHVSLSVGQFDSDGKRIDIDQLTKKFYSQRFILRK